MHRAAGLSQSDVIADLGGGSRAGRGEHLLGIGDLLGGERVGQPVADLPPARRERPRIAQPQDPRHAGTRILGEESELIVDPLCRQVPAAADGRHRDGDEPNDDEGQRAHGDHLAPAEGTADQVVLECGDTQPHAGGDSEGRRRQHDRLRGCERAQIATRRDQGKGPTRARGHPQARRPGQTDPAPESERQRRPGHQQPHQRRARRRPDGEAHDLPPSGRRRRGDRQPEDADGGPTGQERPEHPRRHEDERDTDPCQGCEEHSTRSFALSRQEGSELPRHGGDQHHGDDRGSEARRGGDPCAEDGHSGDGPGAPACSPSHRVGGHPRGPGQGQGDEREGGIGHQTVPAAGAQCTVGKGHPEIADDRDHAGTVGDHGAHQA